MDARHFLYPPAAWPAAPAPGIHPHRPLSAPTVRAIEAALAAVDIDIEQTGTVSAETVDKVRNTLVLLRA